MKNDKKENRSLLKKTLYNLFIVVVSAGALYFALTAYAGSLTPPGPVGSTMRSLQELYDALAGTYNSAGAAPNSNGNAMELLKCITTKMNGGVCS